VKLRLLIAAAAAVAALGFVFAPVSYMTTYWPCGDACSYDLSAAHPVYLPAYQSLSCLAFGYGSGYSTSGAWGNNGTSYRLSCPPKVINAVGNSGG
jgi:hypothetical protein